MITLHIHIPLTVTSAVQFLGVQINSHPFCQLFQPLSILFILFLNQYIRQSSQADKPEPWSTMAYKGHAANKKKKPRKQKRKPHKQKRKQVNKKENTQTKKKLRKQKTKPRK